MPELGKYADVVLSSYAVTLGLIAALVWLSIWRASRVKAQLNDLEKRIKNNG